MGLNDEFQYFKELELLRDQILVARELVSRALPYIEQHYTKSRPTFGMGAKALMDEINKFLANLES